MVKGVEDVGIIPAITVFFQKIWKTVIGKDAIGKEAGRSL